MKSILGIRKETKNVYERRAPLIPAAVEKILKDTDIEAVVESTQQRIYPDDEYRRIGAVVKDEISEAKLILGVKEIPPAYFSAGKVYAFFSHTIKGQEHNMAMLKRMVELKCTLIDFEKIVDNRGQRLVFFSHHAGLAGMIDTLWSFGSKLLAEGLQNPFTKIEPAHKYTSLDRAKAVVAEIGELIRKNGLPPEISPLTCAFLGYGRVAKGAQEIFDLLPVEEVEPSFLPKLFKAKKLPSNRVFKVVFKESDLVKHRENPAYFDLQHYYNHPEEYDSVFHAKLENYSIIMNCVYWDTQYPRFITCESLKRLYSGSGQPRLKVIGDITCDVGGSVECTYKETDAGNPVFVYEPLTGKYIDGFEGNGPVIMAVGNLPSELPLEASQHFSDSLIDFIPAMVKADYSVPFSQLLLPAPIKRAVILYNGEFTQDYEYMKQYIDK